MDREVISRYEIFDTEFRSRLPKIWGYYFVESKSITKTKNFIFIGVPPLRQFGYKEIREFGRKSLVSLASSNPNIESIMFTIHGPGYGLDEVEAFESHIAGLVDSISAGDYPDRLKEIIFIERSSGRANRLQKYLIALFPNGEVPTSNKKIIESSLEIFRSAGYESESKKRVFVAMPFSPEFDDYFHYGIQGAVKACGYLCERADKQSYTGEVMEWVKTRIKSAYLIIADLTTANPNVYLEVGYAWGVSKQTVLLIRDTKDLKFDTRGHRCLPYSSIQELETKLKMELENLQVE